MPALRRRIVAVAGARHPRAGDRRGEDHPPGALRLHRRQRRLGRQEGAAQVDGEHAVPLLGGGVLDQRPGKDAGVLHQDVEPAVRAERRGDRRLGVAAGGAMSVGDEPAAEPRGGGRAFLGQPCRRSSPARPPRRSARRSPRRCRGRRRSPAPTLPSSRRITGSAGACRSSRCRAGPPRAPAPPWIIIV